jgi:DNA-binding PadR family transcriptional regulator
MSRLEYHVLLALAARALHGYAIAEAVAEESGGTLAPRAGSLYRVIGRLETSGWLIEAPVPASEPPHPGLARRYYRLTAAGRRALAAEAARLKLAATTAEKRLGVARSRS